MFLPFQVVPTKNMLSDPCDPKTEARNFQLDNICLPSEKAISCISGDRGERLGAAGSFPFISHQGHSGEGELASHSGPCQNVGETSALYLITTE